MYTLDSYVFNSLCFFFVSIRPPPRSTRTYPLVPYPPLFRSARLVADRLKTHPGSSLRDIASWLSRDLREPTPRGGLSWSPEGVRRVISQAMALRLIAAE